ncbi:hypothetical protein [Helicobacter rodentium]|uniref:hypothetical protein n=1 Tax=Helicobacter rodentium TaxID=59617 RepID=UPI0023545807|nr:hypothetical protein [Helicobacter rodentium]
MQICSQGRILSGHCIFHCVIASKAKQSIILAIKKDSTTKLNYEIPSYGLPRLLRSLAMTNPNIIDCHSLFTKASQGRILSLAFIQNQITTFAKPQKCFIGF